MSRKKNYDNNDHQTAEQLSAEDAANFKVNRVKAIEQLYSDDASTKRRYDRAAGEKASAIKDAAAVRKLLDDAINNRENIVKASKNLYTTNPIYRSIISYLSQMFYWRYTVIPHKLYTKSRIKALKPTKEIDYLQTLNLMQEVVDGLGVETKFPAILTKMFIEGGAYFTTVCDEDSIAIDTLILPDKYCRKIGESQLGTAIINFDFSYFDSIVSNQKERDEYFKSFSPEFKKKYAAFKKDSNKRWQTLDPRYSSCILVNDLSIPTFFYLYGGILDYEKYQDNELQRNENLLKYIVVQTIPHYEDKLIFEIDEVKALHKSLKKIIDTNEKARLVTTYGDIHVDKISENDTSENEVLAKAFKSIFNNAGFNSAIFTAESVEALKMSLIRDKSTVWTYVQQLINFYNVVINNYFDFKSFQADFDILQISPYTYNDDIEIYKTNATLGVGKVQYFVASGIKQKNIQDTLALEKFLGLDSIEPMQTSYTQSAEDRSSGKVEDKKEEQTTNSDSNTRDENNTSDSETTKNEGK